MEAYGRLRTGSWIALAAGGLAGATVGGDLSGAFVGAGLTRALWRLGGLGVYWTEIPDVARRWVLAQAMTGGTLSLAAARMRR